jgi:small subunit ribosomal protein S9
MPLARRKNMKVIVTSGKRKTAIARARLQEGKGEVRINKIELSQYTPLMMQDKIREPLSIAGDIAQKVNIKINVKGGGIASQAEAARLAIGRALVQFNKKLEKDFLDYDRTLLVADIRRKEPRKPNRRGRARAKRQKSYR